MKYIHKLDEYLARVETLLVILILSAMILLAFSQIILRNFFATSLSWGDILLRHLVLWIGFLGASLATREGRHINIDVLTRLVSPPVKRITQAIVNLTASIVCFFLLRASIQFLRFEMEGQSELFNGIPSWVAELIIAIGFGLMMLRFFIQSLNSIFTSTPVHQTDEVPA